MRWLAAVVAGGVYLAALPLALIGVVVLGVVDSSACDRESGSQQLGDRAWSTEQADNARLISETTAVRAFPRRAAVIATATAIVESDLINLNHGDRDSLGLFQQRPSAGWGTPTQVTNPVYATNAFLDHLVRVPRWPDVNLGDAAQAVQQSAFPERYKSREHQAQVLVDRFWRGPDGAVGSTCSGSSGPGDPPRLPPGYVPPADPRQRAAVEYALAQVGKPYVWGAKGPDAFDCSGLMQAAWAHAGVPIAAGTSGQVNTGDAVRSLGEVQSGDLLLTAGATGTPSNPGHVGMYVGANTLVNAYDEQTGVVLDRLENWANKVVAIRRPVQPKIPAEIAR